MQAIKGEGIISSMLECRACVRRCIRAIAGDSQQGQLLSRRPLLLTPRIGQNTFRRHASIATSPPEEDYLVPGRQPVDEGVAEAQEEGDKKQTRPPTVAAEKHLKVELRYLGDQVKLAEHVHYTLRCEKPEKALELCRLASKQGEVIVSWNHCVDWYIQRGKVDEAIKIYNEMKKRAQFPDGHTYSLLLRGLAKPPYRGETVKESHVAKALSIYYSMSSPTSRVKANIIHTNGVLKVCSAALDMDALWGVVAKLPEHGAGAPDHITYAILLDGIRHGAFGKDPMNVPAEGLAANREKAVQEGRAIWRDVVQKWRGGEVQIDERLVCAMAQLLFISSSIHDWDDVLNLVEQTMAIPRQLAAIGSADRHIEHVPQDNDLRQSDPELEADNEGYTDTPTTKAFLPVHNLSRDSAYPNRPTSLSYVAPGNAILNVLVNACTLLRSPKAASAYWDLLTSPSGAYLIQPELGNFHTYLRLLGKNRASAKAVALLQTIKSMDVHPTSVTFRIVMDICVRDKNNPNMLDHARAIIDVMESSLADPDPRTLIKYLNLALLTDNGPKIVFVVNRLDAMVHNLRSRVLYGSDKTGVPEDQHLLEIDEVLFFFRTLVGVIDTLGRRGLVPREEHTHWVGRRAQLDAFIQRANTSLEVSRQKLEQKTGKAVPRAREMDPKKGMRGMKAEEFALRKFRHSRRLEEQEKDDRGRARGLAKWSVRDGRRDVPTKGAVLQKWRKEKAWTGREKGGFADSAMELGESQTLAQLAPARSITPPVLVSTYPESATLNGVTAPNYYMGAADQYTFSTSIPKKTFDGLFSINPEPINWLATAYQAGQLDTPSMTIDLSPLGLSKSTVDFALVNFDKIGCEISWFAPVNSRWTVDTGVLGQCLLDTGGPLIYIDPLLALSYILSILPGYFRTSYPDGQIRYTVDCRIAMPDLYLFLTDREGQVEIWRVPGSYIKGKPDGAGSRWCDSLLLPNFVRWNPAGKCVLGAPFVGSFVVVMDGTNGDWEIGLALRKTT